MRHRFSRRAMLGTLGVGAVGTAAGAWAVSSADDPMKPSAADHSAAGDDDDIPPSRGATKLGGVAQVSNDAVQQIKGYADATSVNRGGEITFHVSVFPPGRYDIAIHRLGADDAPGASIGDGHALTRSPRLAGVTQPPPTTTPDTRTVIAPWKPSWTLRVPREWASGHYVAVLASEAGFQNHVPFVVRDDSRRADFLLVQPYTTYQAYNMYPYDGKRGASLYHGWDARGRWQNESHAATKVSFDRPYAETGLPTLFDIDRRLIAWVERRGYDVAYATSVDLHAGRVDPGKYKGLVFSGHDEYWSVQMRGLVERAAGAGVSLAFMAANSVYWRIRMEPSPQTGDADRVVVCYKGRPDPDAAAHNERTTLWRETGQAEQRLVGAQYISMVNGKHPLVVAAPDHWFWAGAGVRAGDTVKDLVSGEADQVMADAPAPDARWSVTLAASPYPDTRRHTRIHNTVLSQTRAGGYVFVAGTFGWSAGLSDPTMADQRVQRATANLFDRIRANVPGTMI